MSDCHSTLLYGARILSLRNFCFVSIEVSTRDVFLKINLNAVFVMAQSDIFALRVNWLIHDCMENSTGRSCFSSI